MLGRHMSNTPTLLVQLPSVPYRIELNLIFVIADFITAMLLRLTGQNLQLAYRQFLRSKKLLNLLETSRNVDAGDVASLVFLWNPFGILTCVGGCTSPIENLMIVLSLYGACSSLPSLSAFGWVIATHLSLYPAILIVPIILLLGYGPDSPPKKLFLLTSMKPARSHPLEQSHEQVSSVDNESELQVHHFSWQPVMSFILWSSIWSFYVLVLCSIFLKDFGSLSEMLKKSFFLIVFHINILFMILPLAIRLKHRPCFLAFVYIAISSMLKSYPSVGDSALYLGLLGLFVNELQDIRFSFFLFFGYIGVSLLSPVMHNLWIWRGTGNANFYFATGIAYACLQTLLVVESVNAVLNHDRMLRKQLTA
ncbi:hypothetical protein Taro_046422 [Colocasia esculenta]|uniref:Phosphatidylinositol glycan anchor biosynthesis class U protein n=1 Tax=Colocasia esculenta TaxID=4460 RepID=A0A843X7D9_COLES|nr:hypothetical protein [Colocasia esculenta]